MTEYDEMYNRCVICCKTMEPLLDGRNLPFVRRCTLCRANASPEGRSLIPIPNREWGIDD